MNKVYNISDDEFRLVVSESFAYTDILRKLGLGGRGGTSSRLLKQRIRDLDITTGHFDRGRTERTSVRRKDLSVVLVENSTYKGIACLKRRLVTEGYMAYTCDECSNTGSWRGKDLVLQLEHINGICDDHRLENLRFLCPNCHSQTETYAGRNKH